MRRITGHILLYFFVYLTTYPEAFLQNPLLFLNTVTFLFTEPLHSSMALYRCIV